MSLYLAPSRFFPGVHIGVVLFSVLFNVLFAFGIVEMLYRLTELWLARE